MEVTVYVKHDHYIGDGSEHGKVQVPTEGCGVEGKVKPWSSPRLDLDTYVILR